MEILLQQCNNSKIYSQKWLLAGWGHLQSSHTPWAGTSQPSCARLDSQHPAWIHSPPHRISTRRMVRSLYPHASARWHQRHAPLWSERDGHNITIQIKFNYDQVVDKQSPAILNTNHDWAGLKLHCGYLIAKWQTNLCHWRDITGVSLSIKHHVNSLSNARSFWLCEGTRSH